jgi:hypothetical protein
MKLDLKLQYIEIYDANTKDIQFLKIPSFQFLMIDGEGNPNSDESYQNAVECLYSISYTLKFSYRERQDYSVMPLETLWWMDDITEFSMANIERWKWTAMIMQPPFVTASMLQMAKHDAAKKKPLPAMPLLRMEKWEEGLCAQVLHKGSYASEESTIARLHETIEAKGYTKIGKHHEIYLNDPRRSAADKLKTIIRQPVCSST